MFSRTKEEIKEQIVRGIEAITDDICHTADIDENLDRAKAIKILAEAYKELTP